MLLRAVTIWTAHKAGLGPFSALQQLKTAPSKEA
jgi:hypothetical protein